MLTSATDRHSLPPRLALLLPVALLLHQVEEWFGGFTEWTRFVVGDGIEPERFLLINATGLVLITLGTLATFREPGMSWIVVAVATLMGINGVLHALASLLMGQYSPGTVTGLLLSLPLSVIVLRAFVGVMPRVQVVGAMLAGVLMHGAVTLLALV